MHRSSIAASITLLFATTVWAAEPSPMNFSVPLEPTRRSVQPMATEPGAAALQIGTPAPMFSYLGADGRWHKWDELLSRGPVLVLFGPSDDELLAVQRRLVAFDELGVRPVSIFSLPTRGTSALTRRLGLSSPVVSDPMSAIAGLYHTVDPLSGRQMPAYFVIDARHTLRAMFYGPLPPAELLVAAAARSLGRPLPASILTSDEH